MQEQDTCKPSSLSRKDVMIDKENVTVDKPRVPKFNIEPQQMKRKKYNLRKSLAWDKAFFTEEGVLDPLELSTLSRNVDRPMFRGGRESQSGGLDCINELPDMQALEDNLFMELPPNTLDEGGMAAGVFSPKPASLARDEAGPSVAKRKNISASNISQSASKRSSCPLPVASSSLRRPPCTNKTKVSTKDSKALKLLAPKPGPSDVYAAPRSSHLKHYQIPHPVGNGQKNIRSKGTSTKTRSVQKDMELGPSDKLLPKSTAHHARSKVSVVPKIHSSTNAQHPQVNQANNCSELIPHLVLPAAAHPLNGSDGCTSKIAISCSQNASCNSENMQSTDSQTTKPSGLRMPSPSLGYFSQSKPSGSLSLLERTQTGKLRESNIPSFLKAGLSNRKCPWQPSKKTSACLNMGSYAASAVNPTSHEKIKCNSEFKNKEMFWAPHNSRTCDGLNNQQKLCDIHDNQSLLQGGPCEQLKKGQHSKKVNEFCLKGRDMTAAGIDYSHSRFNVSLVAEVGGLSEKNCVTASHHIEDSQYIPTIKDNSDYSDFPSLGTTDNSDEGTQKVHVQITTMQEVTNQTVIQAELMKLDTCQVYPVSNAESLSLCLNNNASVVERSAEELNKCSGSNRENAILKSHYRSTGELEIPYSPSCCNGILYTNKESSGRGNLYTELHVGDVQLQPVDGNLTVKRGEKSMPNTLAEYNLPTMIIDDPSEKTAEQTEVPFPCLVTGQAMEDECGAQHDGYLIHGKRFSSEESKEKNLHQSGEDMVSNANACEGKLESSGVLSKSPAKQDSSSNAAGKSECLHVENPLVSSMDKQLITVASEINDMSGDEGLVSKCDSSVKKFVVSYLQPGNVANAKGSSILENNCSTCMHDVKEDVEKKTKVMASFCESDQDNQGQRAFDDMLFTKSRSLEERREFSNSNIASVRGTFASEVESLNGIQQCEIMEQTNELAQFNRTSKETVIQNAQVQSLDGSLLSDSCNSNITLSVANKTSTVLVDDIREQPEHHPAVQNPYVMIKQAPLENYEFCSDDYSLLMNNTSVELQKGDARQNVLGVGLEQVGGSCESGCSDGGTQEPPVVKNAGSDVDKKAEHVFTVDTEQGFMEILPSIENNKCSMDGTNTSDDDLIDQVTSLEFDSSSDSSLFGSLNEKSKLLMKMKEKTGQRVQQDTEVDLSDRNVLPEEAQIKVPQTSTRLSIELQHELDVMHPTEDKDATLSFQKPVQNKKQDACVIKPPLNVVPFSDEWLAAVEAAGEEILTMKGGAVQNSPPDKFQHEPGPWSPVRRKNAQGIGPFDCTKFTNIPPSTSH